MDVKIVPIGDMAIQVICHHENIQQTCKMIMNAYIRGVQELVPGYQSITLYYDPLVLSYSQLYQMIYEICSEDFPNDPLHVKEIVYIPTCYEGEFGIDQERVARITGLTTEKIITLHSSQEYFVRMIGFLPGFPYLQGLREELITPRLAEPRLHVPKGAVGIGGAQTGIYPIESPGGWNLIGRTPVPLFNPTSSTPFLLKAGDYLRFQPISVDEFYEIEQSQHFHVKRELIPLENN